MAPFLGASGFGAYRSISMPIPNVAWTAIAFNSERFDTVGGAASTMHDNATNNSRLTCRVAGKYLIGGHVEWAGNAVGTRRIQVRLNGANGIGNGSPAYAVGDNNPFLGVVTLWDMIVGDYVELIVLQSSGGSLDVIFSANHSPEFWMVRVA
jgi:hypothetical protein